ncbi:hypothetical protein ABW20_dc0105313 [Dactylellina cionopaga]|nr:hypothetical protein ABW20_dc0105313 [Dactylellina cionopaga]
MGLELKGPLEYNAIFYDTWDQVPKSGDGKTPLNPVIDVEYFPSITITSSGTIVCLVLNMTSGTAWFRDPVFLGLAPYDVQGWKFGIAIELNFASIDADAIKSGKPVPPIVLDRLTQFTSNDFKISQLFADLTSTDLARYDPEETSVGNSPVQVRDAFTAFMTNFLQGLKADSTKNPFILGYSITQGSDTPNPDQDIPPSMKPIGQTFNVYLDPNVPDSSNINFILNTQGGQGSNPSGIHPTPGIFDSNWLDLAESCDGKMIYSSYALLETLILKPFYDSLSSQSFNIIQSSGVNIASPPSFAAAGSTTASGRSYTISNVTDGNDQYTNSYTVDLTQASTGITLSFSGRIFTKKTASTNLGICTASAWATGYVTWSSSLTISSGKDSSGKPIVTVSQPVAIINDTGTNSDMNDCAKGWGVVGAILGPVLDAFTLDLDLSPTTEIYAAQDVVGGTLLFTIDPEQKPIVILSTSGSDTSGFSVVNLLDCVSNYEKAIALSVSQDVDGLISLALALSTNNGDTTDILFVDRVTNNIFQTDLAKVLEKAFVVKGIGKGFVVEGLSLGSSDDSQRPILTISGHIKRKRKFYQLQANATDVKLLDLPKV